MSGSEHRNSVEKIIESNPGVDREQFSDAQEAVEALRRSGVRGPSYQLDSPYERGPVGGHPLPPAGARRAG